MFWNFEDRSDLACPIRTQMLHYSHGAAENIPSGHINNLFPPRRPFRPPH
jgi:hypothetical protein